MERKKKQNHAVVVKIARQKQCKIQKIRNKSKGQNIGSGCVKCMELEKATRAAVSELRLDYEIEHVTDFAEIAGYGVMTTPALVFNGEVISYGKVLTVEEVKALLSKK